MLREGQQDVSVSRDTKVLWLSVHPACSPAFPSFFVVGKSIIFVFGAFVSLASTVNINIASALPSMHI